MPIIRKKHHTENFVILDKNFLEDKTISYKAKGLLSLLISRPDAWKVSARELAATSMDGKDSVYSGLKELQEAGYIEYTEVKDTAGKFQGGEYYVYECKPPVNGLSNEQKPCLVKPYRENPTLVNNKLVNNKITTQQETKMVKEDCSVVVFADFESRKLSSQEDQPALPVLLTGEVNTIGEGLTEAQEHFLTQAITRWANQAVITNCEVFREEVRFSLLNPAHLFHAGNDFHKKLNTIGKMVREKRWRTPHGFSKSIPKPACTEDASVSREIRALEIELNSHRQALKGPLGSHPSFKASQIACIEVLESKITSLLEQSNKQVKTLFFNHEHAFSINKERQYDRQQRTA